MTYQTFDQYPDLTLAERNAATTLTFSARSSTSNPQYDVYASYLYLAGFDPFVVRPYFVLPLKQGATYDFSDYSYNTPNLMLYDAQGNAVAVGQPSLTTLGFSEIKGFVAPYSGNYYIGAGWNTTFGQTSVITSVWGDLDTAKHQVTLGSSNDIFVDTGLADVVDAGSGTDVAVYGGPRSSYSLVRTGDTVTVTHMDGGNTDTLTHVERLRFSDVTVALDFDGPAGQAYRLYQAAFNRTPDQAGLAFQVAAVDGFGLAAVAQNFIDSPEFQKTYGALNDQQFVNQLYLNVLHRAGEASGVAFHVNELAIGLSRAQVLANFSESPENQLALIGVMAPWFSYPST